MSTSNLENTNLDSSELEHYQSVSRLAVIAALVACAAPLVLTSPILAVVPMLACVIAIVAIRQINKSDGALTGSSLAVGALLISLLFLGWGLTWQIARQADVCLKAETVADTFVQLVLEGRQREAHQFTYDTADRVGSLSGMNERYDKDKEASDSLKNFYSNAPLPILLTEGKETTVQFVTVARQVKAGNEDVIILEYEVRTKSGNVLGMWISVTRRYDPANGVVNWRISSVSDRLPQVY